MNLYTSTTILLPGTIHMKNCVLSHRVQLTYLEETSNSFLQVHHGQVFTLCKKHVLNLAHVPVHQVR